MSQQDAEQGFMKDVSHIELKYKAEQNEVLGQRVRILGRQRPGRTENHKLFLTSTHMWAMCTQPQHTFPCV